jgi:pimeloyl-ACP methyl ester carboxylesterase
MRADYWSNLTPALEQHFSLLVIDMPGHGESPVLTAESKTIASYTDCIADVLAQQNEAVFVAGHSMGALISVDLATRYSKYVRATAVLNGVFQREAIASAAVQDRADKLDGQSISDPTATLERWFGENPQGVDAQAADHCRDWLLTLNPAGYRDAYRAFAYDDGPSVSDIRGISCPALFTTGELEPNSTPAMSQSMASIAPKGEYCEIKGAKHMMSMTHGAQLSDLMTSFFHQAGSV